MGPILVQGGGGGGGVYLGSQGRRKRAFRRIRIEGCDTDTACASNNPLWYGLAPN